MPDCWKGPLGSDWEDVLSIIIRKWSPESYRAKPLIEYLRAVPDPRCGRKTKHDHARSAAVSGDWLPMRQDGHTQGSEIVPEKSWAAEKICTPGERCRFPIHSMQDPGRRRRETVCPGIYGMGQGDCEYKGIHLAVDGKALRVVMKKVKNFRTSMVMNAMDVATGLVIAQGGHFLPQIKGNQSQSYGEIEKYFEEMSEDYGKMKEDANFKPRHPEMMEGYKGCTAWRKAETAMKGAGTKYAPAC